MKARVRLLSVTQPEWATFVDFTTEVTGVSPTRVCDKSNTPVGDTGSYLLCLEDFAIEQAMNHISVSFLVQADLTTILSVMSHNIRCLQAEREADEGKLVVLTGSLIDWKQIIVDLSHRRKTRFLVNQCYVLLDQRNLGRVFKGIKKVSQPDGTFLME